MQQDGHILSVEHINFSYGERKILSDISFSVAAGEICGLLGPNGSGKTTLLKCVNRILEGNTGTIKIRGRDISRLSRLEISRLVAIVPQELNVMFAFTVLQMVLMGGSGRYGFSGIPGRRDYQHAMEVLEELNIDHLAERKYNELSGGEKQMVLIAKALFQGAEVLLLDEPISHLDFKRQYTIMELIKKITAGKGLTTLITLHDPNIAGRYCHRLIMLNEGSVAHQGLTDTVFHPESLGAIYDMKIRIEYTDAGIGYVLPDHVQ
jgi:iron complex transport system ATP-binding protein